MDEEDCEEIEKFLQSLPGHITVKYGWVHGLTIEKGCEMKPVQMIDPPEHIFWPIDDAGSLYTLSMVDLNPIYIEQFTHQQFSHWLVVNIPGGYIHEGLVISPYLGPQPKRESGIHHLAILIYKQPDLITDVSLHTSAWNRFNFDIREFAKNHDLGDPIAGTWFVMKDDEYSRNCREKSFSFNPTNKVSVFSKYCQKCCCVV